MNFEAISYNPTPRVEEILNWCLEKINEVPYKTPLRWVFYRAVQEKGLGKKSYNNFKKWTSNARKRFWNGWRPDTLIDDTREIMHNGGGYETPEKWKIPDNPERPNQYQWEALDDDAAKELIQDALEKVVDLEAIAEVEELEDETTEKWRNIIEKSLEEVKDT